MIVINKDGSSVSKELSDVINEQIIYWSDDRLCHWFFDFEFKGQWISSHKINNELTEVIIEIFDKGELS